MKKLGSVFSSRRPLWGKVQLMERLSSTNKNHPPGALPEAVKQRFPWLPIPCDN